MKKLPTSFEFGSNTVRVIQVSKDEMAKASGDKPNDAPWGLFVPGESVIYIQKARKGFTKETQMHTFWHEVFHALFWNLGRTKMYEDETLVDQCGNLMLQALKTAK